MGRLKEVTLDIKDMVLCFGHGKRTRKVQYTRVYTNKKDEHYM